MQTGRYNQWTPTEREVVESWNWQLVGRVEQRKRSILLMPNGKLKKENKFFVFAFFSPWWMKVRIATLICKPSADNNFYLILVAHKILQFLLQLFYWHEPTILFSLLTIAIKTIVAKNVQIYLWNFSTFQKKI